MKYNAITVLGPTATGKTKLAAQIAHHFDGEIISADSRQVYKGMDLGTGKDYEDYKVENNTIPCHLIDIYEPALEFNVFLFKEFFKAAYFQISEKSKLPIICGGTGLYLSSVLQNYKMTVKDDSLKYELEKYSFEELKSLYIQYNKTPHNTTDLSDKERILSALLILRSESNKYTDTSEIRSFVIGINPGRDEIKRRISERLKKRLEAGMIKEVESLMENGISAERMLALGLEYKYIALYLTNQLSYNDMYQKLNSAIHSFAKRQMTWFRKMEKEGVGINWISSNAFIQAKKLIENAGFSSK
jgi:tRNA dimethylallyltransferase